MTGSSVRDLLCAIIQSHGPTICQDEFTTVGLLKDHYPEARRMRNLLVTALRENVARNLLDWQEDGGPIEIVLKKCEDRLVHNQSIDTTGARWAVLCWSVALGRITAADMDQRLGLAAAVPVPPLPPAPAPKPSPAPPAPAPKPAPTPPVPAPKPSPAPPTPAPKPAPAPPVPVPKPSPAPPTPAPKPAPAPPVPALKPSPAPPTPAPKPAPTPPVPAPKPSPAPPTPAPKPAPKPVPAPTAKKKISAGDVVGAVGAVLFVIAIIYGGFQLLTYLTVDQKIPFQTVWVGGIAIVGLFKFIKYLIKS
jgi:hypothetical protein